jgi:Domain of unknown function (DUF4440)
MSKLSAFLAFWLVLCPAWGQTKFQSDCIQRCMTAAPADPDLERAEILNLEREAAHAIQLNEGTFFRRVYSDDFSGTLSHGEVVNKNTFVSVVESTTIKYQSFNASDIKIHVYRDTAVATCLWSARLVLKGQIVNSQMRAMHIYVNGGNGWKVVAGQASALPPYIQQPL